MNILYHDFEKKIKKPLKYFEKPPIYITTEANKDLLTKFISDDREEVT